MTEQRPTYPERYPPSWIGKAGDIGSLRAFKLSYATIRQIVASRSGDRTKAQRTYKLVLDAVDTLHREQKVQLFSVGKVYELICAAARDVGWYERNK